METFKIFRKYDVWCMPIILEYEIFKIIITSANFKKFKIIKIGKYFVNYYVIKSLC
jgi:hypothetical protein